jgi:hypothetical protein
VVNPVIDRDDQNHTGIQDPAAWKQLPAEAAPAWVHGYLTGHERGTAEGYDKAYADYDRSLVEGLAGMLAGDPKVTNYREGVRRHERMADAARRRAEADAAVRTATELATTVSQTAGHSQAFADWLSEAEADALTKAGVTARDLIAAGRVWEQELLPALLDRLRHQENQATDDDTDGM